MIECETYVPPRGKRIDVAIVDLESAPDDSLRLVRQLRMQLEGTYLAILGAPMRLAAAANGSADAELELSRADASVLRAVLATRPPPPSSELARAHRLWAEVTPRQREVLCWLAIGLDNPGIAERMRIGERAVKAHVSALLVLFGAANRTKLALIAHQAGLRPSAR